MIRATLWKNASGEFTGYDLSGHAGYAEEGMDIICSAVSSLALNTANSIEVFTAVCPRTEESDGLLKVSFSKTDDAAEWQKVQLLMNSLKLGLDSIESSYGSMYLQVKTIRR